LKYQSRKKFEFLNFNTLFQLRVEFGPNAPASDEEEGRSFTTIKTEFQIYFKQICHKKTRPSNSQMPKLLQCKHQKIKWTEESKRSKAWHTTMSSTERWQVKILQFKFQ
jgi:hypothetical protein